MHAFSSVTDDWVRREIEVALQRDIWVLPVLVGNATPEFRQGVYEFVAFVRDKLMALIDRVGQSADNT